MSVTGLYWPSLFGEYHDKVDGSVDNSGGVYQDGSSGIPLRFQSQLAAVVYLDTSAGEMELYTYG